MTVNIVNIVNLYQKRKIMNKTRKGTLLEITPAEIKALKLNDSNRLVGVKKDAYQIRLNNLKKNMQKYGYRRAFPIVLNEDLIICDGHHRAQACIDLGISAWVIIDPDAKVQEYAQMSNSTNKWRISDYVKAKVNEGVKAAQVVEYLMEKYKFAPQLIMRLEFGFSLTNSYIINMINEGKFDFKSVKRIEILCQHIQECQLYIAAKQDKVKIALAMMMEHPEYQQDRMLTKLQQKGGEIYPSAVTSNYMEQLQKLYNSGLRTGKIYFL
tara:strand:+ start:163 stop:966 length:804 start_codon:yes stop_codon:yes gene_type:complete